MRDIFQQIKLNVKNIPGWKTDRKIVAFAVDDYGNVRVHSKKARDRMNKAGLKVENRFDAYDALETEQDLSLLFDTLSSVKDAHGRHPVFTALTVVANINFEDQLERSKYVYELLPETFVKNKQEKTWILWQEGTTKGLLFPQFHGREHLNVKLLEANLDLGEYTTRVSIENKSYTSIHNQLFPTISYTAAFDIETSDDLTPQEEILRKGLDHFEEIFGWRSKTFNPPGGRENRFLHKVLFDNGIEFIETPFLKKEHMGNNKYRWSLNYTGKRNIYGQHFLVRNCVFEPTSNDKIDWVGLCVKQIESAFQRKKPAVISSHRVNFCGHIEENNRKQGISSLKHLLNEILNLWPEVEFMSTLELVNHLRTNHV